MKEITCMFRCICQWFSRLRCRRRQYQSPQIFSRISKLDVAAKLVEGLSRGKYSFAVNVLKTCNELDTKNWNGYVASGVSGESSFPDTIKLQDCIKNRSCARCTVHTEMVLGFFESHWITEWRDEVFSDSKPEVLDIHGWSLKTIILYILYGTSM